MMLIWIESSNGKMSVVGFQLCGHNQAMCVSTWLGRRDRGLIRLDAHSVSCQRLSQILDGVLMFGS